MKTKFLQRQRTLSLVLISLLMTAGIAIANAQAPTGAINGLFSVGENTGVVFSQGNLQYKASTNTWQFATNQYDYIGSANSNISSTYTGWIDLFGWGTSGYNHGANCYQPWSTSTSNSDYYAYGNSQYNLFDQTGKADWGYNSISNGGNEENSGWRTLTTEEWYYLFYTRSTASGIRYAKATVNNVKGVILLPDDWSSDYYTLSNTNTSGGGFSGNIITASQWAILEQHGAVFLPAAGNRYGSSVSDVGSSGYYWSASYSYNYRAYYVYFLDGNLDASYYGYRGYGLSVRLVRAVENYSIHATPNPVEGGAVSGAGAYQAGAECTLTATASAGYTFAYWTQNGRVVSEDATYTFAVGNNRDLVAVFAPSISTGKLNGQFTVGENAVVCFSQGNLQYKASTNTWRFAENQWDYVGFDNSNISQTYSGLIDLFGWGTSGFNHGAICYQPWSTSTSSSSYYVYGNSSYNLFDQTGQADWGYNAISNGGNQEHSGWRTLTTEEWYYLFNTRVTSSGIRYAKARVNNVSGVILLPDDWQTSYYSLNSTNTSGASFSTNVITVTQWNTLQQHGVVFLPIAGARDGTSVGNVGSVGYYWSASYNYSSYAYIVYFNDGNLSASDYGRYHGQSVRLVRAVENYSIHATPSPAEGGAVSGAGAYLEGAECTLTATASAGYTFAYWTENGEVVSTDAEYTFMLTGDRTLVANFTQNGSMGKLNGQFTVGENAVVCFSQGNLQYKGSTNTWRFAENQYDYVGSDNSNISQTYSGLIDLFGWGTSGYNHGANCYQPWSTSTSDSYYYAYGNSSYNLFDQTGKADWGYNAISNGGNEENSGWRTMTKVEWNYLFNTRATSSGIRYAKARVNSVNGVILLPDDWSSDYYTLNNTNTSGANFSTNVITVSQWTTLEQHGAVFLPAAGYRRGTSVYNVGSLGDYWSASYDGSEGAYGVYFSDGSLDASSGYYRSYGRSVRLVRAVENYSIHATPSPAEGGAVSGAGAYQVGAECTLTATASAGYTFAYWTENGEVVSTDAEYTFMLTGDRTLVANFTQNGSMGKLNGQFTVGENAVVCFSQGNLQYKASTNTWRFAENQYDYVGSDNSNISQTYNGLIDLFGWGTSGYNHGAVCYQPWSTSTSYSDYYAYGYDLYSLFDLTGKADWGYNAISNGGNTENSGWRTLTRNEWVYLFNTRSTSSGIRYAKATVNSVNGVILLPDDWSADYYTLNNTNTQGVNFSTNVITVSQWATLEQHGAVFLPAAGTRYGTSVSYVGSNGYYWSASYGDSDRACIVVFDYGSLSASYGGGRLFGRSVRLVRAVENYSIHATPSPAEGGAVSGVGAYQVGAECTLTATASAGYTFAYWTENGEVVSTDAEYTFTVTANRDLVANFEQLDNHWTPVSGMSGSMTILGILKIDGVEPHAYYLEVGAFSGSECRGSALPEFIDNYCVYALNIAGDTEGQPITFKVYDHHLGQELDLHCTNELVFADGMYYGMEEFYEFNFLNYYQVTASVDPADAGTVTGADIYTYGSSCTLTATANEGWQFNSWTVDGETVSTETTYSFTVEGPANVTALFDLAQTVELKQGWTWWSTGVELTGIDGLSILEEGLNPYGRVIKNNEKFVQYQVALNRWIGGLNVLTNEEGYKVNASQTCPVTIVGPAANPEDHPITIHSNWTWIGYPASHQQSVGAALAGFNPEVNDIIKSQSSSARYLPNTGWIPATFTLNPGESYMYYSKAADDKTLVYANGRSAVTSVNDDRHWRNDVHAFADNLCLLAVVELDGVEQRSDALELGAFVNGECRGSAKLMYVEPLDRYFAMLTVMGEDGDEIEFALTDHNNVKTKYQSENHLTFATDAIVGEFDDPFVVRFGGLSSVEEQDLTLGLYPNPVGRNEAFRLLVPEDETVTEWTVVNALGAVVRHEAATGMPQETRIEGLPVSGVYLVKVSCQSGKVYWNRLIVK